jgi:hypothetical protein
MAERFPNFEAFWPYYLGEHRSQVNRRLHLVGTSLGLSLAAAAVAVGLWWLAPLATLPAYGLAWLGHFRVEKNRPATFSYPLYSLRADFRMLGMALTGRLPAELQKHGLQA